MSLDLDFIDLAPFMESDYPLFSWDDFPQSRDSLVKGTPVEQFETACWNAMVSKMHDILIAVGHDWQSVPYFYNGESKVFTADMYSRMAYIMGYAFKIYWAEYKNLYMSDPGDPLTTGHLKFIAKYLNKVIRTARGTDAIARLQVNHNSAIQTDIQLAVKPAWPLTAAYFGHISSKTWTDMNLDLLLSVPVNTKHTGHSAIEANVATLSAQKLEIDQTLRTHFHVFPEKRTAVPGGASVGSRSCSRVTISRVIAAGQPEVDNLSRSISKVKLNVSKTNPLSVNSAAFSASEAEASVRPGIRAEAENESWSTVVVSADAASSRLVGFLPLIGRSNTAPDISCKNAEVTGKINLIGHSNLDAEAFSRSAASACADIVSRSVPEVSADIRGAVPTGAEEASRSLQYANAITRTARPAWADVVSKGNAAANVDLLDAVNVTVSQSSETAAYCTLDLLDGADIQGNTLAFSKTSCEAAIFLLPLQQDRKTLYIRQTYKEAIKIGNTLYVDEWPDQGLTDDGTLFLWHIYDTVLQVGNTLYIGSMPDTGKTDGETLLIWDVEQEPVQTLTLLEVF